MTKDEKLLEQLDRMVEEYDVSVSQLREPLDVYEREDKKRKANQHFQQIEQASSKHFVGHVLIDVLAYLSEYATSEKMNSEGFMSVLFDIRRVIWLHRLHFKEGMEQLDLLKNGSDLPEGAKITYKKKEGEDG